VHCFKNERFRRPEKAAQGFKMNIFALGLPPPRQQSMTEVRNVEQQQSNLSGFGD